MKKFLIILCIFLMFVSTAWAGSAQKKIGSTADTLITAGTGWLKGLIINTDGTNSVTFDLYDNASAASGNKIISSIVVTTSATNRVTTISFDQSECLYFAGVYVDITTSGTVTYDVFFESN